MPLGAGFDLDGGVGLPLGAVFFAAVVIGMTPMGFSVVSGSIAVDETTIFGFAVDGITFVGLLVVGMRIVLTSATGGVALGGFTSIDLATIVRLVGNVVVSPAIISVVWIMSRTSPPHMGSIPCTFISKTVESSPVRIITVPRGFNSP